MPNFLKVRIVIDTNDYISALIGKKHREKLRFVLDHSDIEVFADEITIMLAKVRVSFALIKAGFILLTND